MYEQQDCPARKRVDVLPNGVIKTSYVDGKGVSMWHNHVSPEIGTKTAADDAALQSAPVASPKSAAAEADVSVGEIDWNDLGDLPCQDFTAPADRRRSTLLGRFTGVEVEDCPLSPLYRDVGLGGCVGVAKATRGLWMSPLCLSVDPPLSHTPNVFLSPATISVGVL